MNLTKLTSFKASAFALAFLTSSSSFAITGHAGVDISLSDETGRLGVYSTKESDVEHTTLGIDYFFNEPQDQMFSLKGSVLRKGFAGNDNLEAGVAGQLFYTLRDKEIKNANSASGLMLGVAARYWVPAAVPVSVMGNFLYSPRIITGGDADYATETNVRGELKILPSAVAYVGFRQITMNYPGIDYELDKNIHVGVKVAFK